MSESIKTNCPTHGEMYSRDGTCPECRAMRPNPPEKKLTPDELEALVMKLALENEIPTLAIFGTGGGQVKYRFVGIREGAAIDFCRAVHEAIVKSIKTLGVILLLALGGSAKALEAGPISDATVGAAVVGSIAAMPTWKKRGVAAAGHLVNFGLNQGLKNLLGNPCQIFAVRPDGSDCFGMPSGHSQSAMFGAGLICQEYGGLPCAGGVTIGLSTMAGRVVAKRHTIEQVSLGGALGFLGGFWGIQISGVF